MKTESVTNLVPVRHLLAALFLMVTFYSAVSQQIVQRGAGGKPSQVLDETGQWTTPLLLAGDPDVAIYMPDVSSPQWLQRNYPAYQGKGLYTLSLFTFYKTPAACKANQIGWGLGDAAHLDACSTISYRIRQATIDPGQRSVTLISAAMADANGTVVPSSIVDGGTFRLWDQLDANTQTALKKADALVALQMKRYDDLQHGIQ